MFMYFVLMGEWNTNEQVIHARGRGEDASKGKHVLRRAESHCCEVNPFETFACNFSILFNVFKGIHFRKSLTESEWSDRF